MVELQPNTVDAMVEKHVPQISCRDGHTVCVKVGSSEHPMETTHYIKFIVLETTRGGQVQFLRPGEHPMAEFMVCNDKVVAAYAYCNIHSLWAKEADCRDKEAKDADCHGKESCCGSPKDKTHCKTK